MNRRTGNRGRGVAERGHLPAAGQPSPAQLMPVMGQRVLEEAEPAVPRIGPDHPLALVPSCPSPGPAAPAPSTRVTPAGAGPWASSTARTARPSCAGSDSERHARCPCCEEPVAAVELVPEAAGTMAEPPPGTGPRHLLRHTAASPRCRRSSATALAAPYPHRPQEMPAYRAAPTPRQPLLTGTISEGAV